MPLHLLDNDLWFPDVEQALDDGLLAIGGDLSCERLLLAYRKGIFPWFNEDEIPMWWCPDPRFVLFPGEIKVSKSMKQVLRSGKFEFRTNTDFPSVIANCRNVFRPGQDGTWIGDDVVKAYNELHKCGHVVSAECWADSQLVGGLYGLKMGKVFFGESMFSFMANASKYAFINWVEQLQSEGVQLIDCQVYTDHLHSLGARMISRSQFVKMLDKLVET